MTGFQVFFSFERYIVQFVFAAFLLLLGWLEDQIYTTDFRVQWKSFSTLSFYMAPLSSSRPLVF